MSTTSSATARRVQDLGRLVSCDGSLTDERERKCVPMNASIEQLLGLLKEAQGLVSTAITPPAPAAKSPPSGKLHTAEKDKKRKGCSASPTSVRQERGFASKRCAADCEAGPASKRRCVAAESELKKIQSILELYECPIRSQLMVLPVVAEDGFLYDRPAIEKWLGMNSTSPKTSAKMGKRLIDDFVARQTITKLVEGGYVDDEEAVAWHIGTGKQHLNGTLSGGAAIAAEHFKAAADLGSSEAAMHMVGCELQRLLTSYEAKSGIELVALVQRTRRRLMSTWVRLKVGAKVWIVDDVAELERLCERAAPGSEVEDGVNYNEEMASLCGKVCEVTEVNEFRRAFTICAEDGEEWMVPYDACAVVED